MKISYLGRMKVPITLTLALLALLFLTSSCTTVKPWQRAYLNDASMQSGSTPSEAFEQSVFSYREGSMISGSKKGKGGCGCN